MSSVEENELIDMLSMNFVSVYAKNMEKKICFLQRECKNVCTLHVINSLELEKVDLIRLDYWTRFGK